MAWFGNSINILVQDCKRAAWQLYITEAIIASPKHDNWQELCLRAIHCSILIRDHSLIPEQSNPRHAVFSPSPSWLRRHVCCLCDFDATAGQHWQQWQQCQRWQHKQHWQQWSKPSLGQTASTLSSALLQILSARERVAVPVADI